MSDTDQWKKDTNRFNRIFVRAIIISLIIGLAIGLGFKLAKAEEPESQQYTPTLDFNDPYKIAQRAWMCRTLSDGAASMTVPRNPWKPTQWDARPSAEYLGWSNLLASASAWSVIHGHSLWTLDRAHRNAVMSPVFEPELAAACQEDYKTFPEKLRTAIGQTYSKNIQDTRARILPTQDDPTTDPELHLKEAAWCVAAFKHALSALDVDPKGYFGFDTGTDEGKEKLARSLKLYGNQRDWWQRRADALAAQENAPRLRTKQEYLLEDIVVFFDRAGLQPGDVGFTKRHFVLQESNFCAEKARTIWSDNE
ncbi:hypothetical protein [Hyphococcus sp.]|uniref:hypothetical protein n=1 Tax=Hyphococcus sp. TaxID=2038636 RepID=UPI0035C787F6